MKIKLKKGCFSHVSCCFFGNLWIFQPLRTLELIEINDYKLTPVLIDFAICLPSFYTDHYLSEKEKKIARR